MRIGINALFLDTPASGSGQYLLHLINALAKFDTHNEYILLGPQAIKNEDGKSADAETSRGGSGGGSGDGGLRRPPMPVQNLIGAS